MKIQKGIWIDSKEAIIVSIEDGKQKNINKIISNLENKVHHEGEGDKGTRFGEQSVNNEFTFNERRKHQLSDYYNLVIDAIKESDELFIFGPSITKTDLHKTILAIKSFKPMIISVETADSMTENQIAAKCRQFFACENNGND